MRLVYLSLLLCIPGWIHAQVKFEEAYFDPVELHPVWLETDLASSVFPEADLILIQDYCEVHFELFSRVPQVRYEVVRRMKIPGNSDLNSASMEFSVSKIRDESLFDWKAATLGFNAEGDIIRFPVSKRGLVEKKGENENTYSVNFPFVKPGAVLELRYSLRSDQLQELRPWMFQGDYPLIMSAVKTFIPYSYQYLVIPTGNLEGIITSNDRFQGSEFSRPPVRTNPNTAELNALGNSIVRTNGNANTYMMTKMPAIREAEAFSPSSTEAYLPSLRWQLSEDLYQRANNENLFESWQQLDRVTYRKFKYRKFPRRFRNELGNRVARTNRMREPEAIQSLYEYFSRFDWDETYRRLPENAGKSWKEEEGSSADINTLLLYALRQAGVEAYPVLISTRSNGFAQATYPLISQFNHLLVAYKNDGEIVLLDASSGIPRAGLLPTEDLNGEGFLLNGRGGEWVPLQSYQKVNQVTYSRFTMAEDGTMVGEVSVVNQNFSSELEMMKLVEVGEDVKEYFDKYVWSGAETVSISNGRVNQSIESDQALEISVDVSMDEFVIKAEDLLILRPMLMRSLIDNPFTEEERIAPVVLPYPLWEAHMLGLRIPEGYELVQVPESIRVQMPGDAGQFIYNVIADEKIIHVTSSIEINRTRFSPEEYQGIRDFFEYIVSKHQEDIVIKKLN